MFRMIGVILLGLGALSRSAQPAWAQLNSRYFKDEPDAQGIVQGAVSRNIEDLGLALGYQEGDTLTFAELNRGT